MRTMTHNSRTNSAGRVHGSKHNDRRFDVSKADNIDVSRMKQNVYINRFNDPSLSFEQAELKTYENLFSDQLRETNEKYIANRHPERCKTMDQFIKLRQYCPEETVLQIGKMEEHVDLDMLKRVYIEYTHRMNEWNDSHGKPYVIMTVALHADEAVPHIQQRRVWRYLDDKGINRVGQERALQKADVELPHPDKPEGKHNNRKMTFDKMSRNIWLDVCEEFGLTVEREPVPDGKHNREKEEMIRDKYNAMIAMTESLEKDSVELQVDIKSYRQERDEIHTECLDQERKRYANEKKAEAAQKRLSELTLLVGDTENTLSELQNAVLSTEMKLNDVSHQKQQEIAEIENLRLAKGKLHDAYKENLTYLQKLVADLKDHLPRFIEEYKDRLSHPTVKELSKLIPEESASSMEGNEPVRSNDYPDQERTTVKTKTKSRGR